VIFTEKVEQSNWTEALLTHLGDLFGNGTAWLDYGFDLIEKRT